MKLATRMHRALLAAAIITAAASGAQAQVTSGDTLSRPTPPDRPQRADSVQAAIGRDNVMPSIEIGQSYTFDRDELFRTGALTLADLLNRIPTLTTFRSGWLAAPQVAAFGGDFSRVRLFVDGIEMDDLEPRNAAAPDLRAFPISTLERVSLSRTANELRVDMRTWQYNLTTPYTRVDVLTGDLNTNLYRVFYGKRFYNGTGLQIAGQQYGVTDTRNGGGGDQLTMLGRYGVGRPGWSLDATAIRTNGTRTTTFRFDGGVPLSGYRFANTLGYIRAAIGKEGSGPFLQLVASTQLLKEYSSHIDSALASQSGFVRDTVDTLASATQYVATAGFDRFGGRLRLIERYRTRLGQGYNSPSATFDLTQRFLSINALAERDEYAGLTRLEAGGRLTPIPFLSVAGYVGQRTGLSAAAPGHFPQPNSRAARVEGGVRLLPAGLWATVGAVTRDTALLVPPSVFDTAYVPVRVGRRTGTTAALRGPIGYGFSVDASGTHWQTPGSYTPEWQAHADLRFYTEWLSRFPRGNFSFLLQPTLDYRSEVAFPTATGPLQTHAAKEYSVLVELRILRGVLTFQRRNISNLQYDQVPGYLMPRPLNVYGIRWYFFD